MQGYGQCYFKAESNNSREVFLQCRRGCFSIGHAGSMLVAVDPP